MIKIGRNPSRGEYVQNKFKGHTIINFDANASSCRLRTAMNAMVMWTLSTNVHNQNNIVSAAFNEELEQRASKLDEILGIKDPNQRRYIFTSGASESNMSALTACVRYLRSDHDAPAVATPIMPEDEPPKVHQSGSPAVPSEDEPPKVPMSVLIMPDILPGTMTPELAEKMRVHMITNKLNFLKNRERAESDATTSDHVGVGRAVPVETDDSINQIGMLGYGDLVGGRKDITIITTILEHESLLQAVHSLDCDVVMIAPVGNGKVTPAMLEEALTSVPDPKMTIVTIMGANNITGVINDISFLSKMAKKYGALFHTDITQLVGKREPLKYFNEQHIDAFSLSGHKIGSPVGVGLMYLNSRIVTSGHITIPGTQQGGLRGGTLNPGGVMSLMVSIENANINIIEKNVYRQSIKQYLMDKIFKMRTDKIRLTVVDTRGVDYASHIVLVSLDTLCARNVVKLMGTTVMCGCYVIVGMGSACNGESETIYDKVPAYINFKNILRITFDDSMTKRYCEIFLKSLKGALCAECITRDRHMT